MRPVTLQWSQHPVSRFCRLTFMDMDNPWLRTPGVLALFPLYQRGQVYIGDAPDIGALLRQLRVPTRFRREEVDVT